MLLFLRLSQLFLTIIIIYPAQGKILEVYNGSAFNKNNQLVYTENHTVTFTDSRMPLKAITIYTNPKGKVIGSLKSNFTKSVSAPAYIYKDLRHNTGHGIRYDGNQLVLLQMSKDGKTHTKKLTQNIPENSLIIGGQGFHYYLLSKFEEITNFKNTPIIFLAPGNLDYYNFKLNYLNTSNNGVINLEIKISNLILRIFAPKLEIQYNKNNKQLLTYEGISNIKDDNNKEQNVKIIYKYN